MYSPNRSHTRWLASVLGTCLVLANLWVATPAYAASMCVEDTVNDVVDQATKQNVYIPQIDIVALCASNAPNRIEITVRTVAPSNPQTDPIWENQSVTVGASISTDGTDNSSYDINYVRDAIGNVTANVYKHQTSEIACRAQASFAGDRYVARIDPGCIGSPISIKVAAYVVKGVDLQNQDKTGQWDDVPNRGGMIGPLSTAPDYVPGNVQRLSGPSRINTSISISQSQFGPRTAGAVILARQDNYPDALAAASLARAKSAPVLLSFKDSLYHEVIAEIRRVLDPSGTVYITGGRAAIDDSVVAAIQATGYRVVRVSGPSREETAVAIANEAKPYPNAVVVADGHTFADALVAGSLASHRDAVQLLTSGRSLHPAARQWLATHPGIEVIAIGPAARDALGGLATKVYAQSNPADTSVLVAQSEYSNPPIVGLASATNYPDGLSGGSNIASVNGPLLLTYPDVIPAQVRSYLDATPSVNGVRAYGGAAAIANSVLVEAGNAA